MAPLVGSSLNHVISVRIHPKCQCTTNAHPLHHKIPTIPLISTNHRPTTAQRCRSAIVSAADPTSSSSPTHHAWQRPDLHVVLVHPQIPQNVGNIARTCAATSMALHLVAPLGFTIDNAKLKRAGLDYWDYVSFRVHNSIDDFGTYFNELPSPKRLFGFSKFATRHYAANNTTSEGSTTSLSPVVGTSYRKGDWLMFGAETTGLPKEAVDLAVQSGGGLVKIPMNNYKYVRSLNLATSVGIGMFEAIRQLDGAVLPEDVEGEE